jgi:hypothetical protein
MDRNLKVAYDRKNLSGKTGNVAFHGIIFRLNKSSLYAPGNGERDFTKDGGPYHYGNVILTNVDDDPVTGKGNIYAEGTIKIEGNSSKIKSGTDSIALYSSGDISMNMSGGDAMFTGLIYSMGDFYCTVPKDKKIKITGALLVAGKDPSRDPEGASVDPGIMSLEGNEVTFQFDETFLSPLPSANSGVSMDLKSYTGINRYRLSASGMSLAEIIFSLGIVSIILVSLIATFFAGFAAMQNVLPIRML